MEITLPLWEYVIFALTLMLPSSSGLELHPGVVFWRAESTPAIEPLAHLEVRHTR